MPHELTRTTIRDRDEECACAGCGHPFTRGADALWDSVAEAFVCSRTCSRAARAATVGA